MSAPTDPGAMSSTPGYKGPDCRAHASCRIAAKMLCSYVAVATVVHVLVVFIIDTCNNDFQNAKNVTSKCLNMANMASRRAIKNTYTCRVGIAKKGQVGIRSSPRNKGKSPGTGSGPRGGKTKRRI